jgi:hypothetical protein
MSKTVEQIDSRSWKVTENFGNYSSTYMVYDEDPNKTETRRSFESLTEADLSAIRSIIGTAGAQGTAGSNGSNGSNGAQGTQGRQGVAGSNGSNGTQGATGATGTGTQGIQGRQGTTGATGPAGTNGSNGGTGLQGIQGPAGSGGSGGGRGSSTVGYSSAVTLHNFGAPAELQNPIDISALIVGTGRDGVARLYLSHTPDRISPGAVLIGFVSITSLTKVIKFERTLAGLDLYEYYGESEGDVYDYTRTSMYMYQNTTTSVRSDAERQTDGSWSLAEVSLEDRTGVVGGSYKYYLVLQTDGPKIYYANTQHG